MASDAQSILSNLRARGVRLWLNEVGKPLLDPAGLLTEQDKADMKAHRSELIAILQNEEEAEKLRDRVEQPIPPAGARIYLCKRDCTECGPGDEVYMWCWEGGPQWYYTPQYPPPIQPPTRKHRAKADEPDETVFKQAKRKKTTSTESE